LAADELLPPPGLSVGPGVLAVGSDGLPGTQFSRLDTSTSSFEVELPNLSTPLEDNPPSLGVQDFTVCHRSVTVTLPL
jgi:hypothetical protein